MVTHTRSPWNLAYRFAILGFYRVGVAVDHIVGAKVGSRAVRVGAGVEADHRGADGGAEVGRAGVGADEGYCAFEYCEQLLEVGLADEVGQCVAAAIDVEAAVDLRPVLPLQAAGTAAQDDLQAMVFDGMFRHGGITGTGPVAVGHAGAGADDHVGAVGEQCLGLQAVGVRDRDIPAQYPLGNTECLGEAEKAVDDVLVLVCGDPVVGKQPLQVLGPVSIKTEAHIGPYQQAGNTGADRHLHVQQQIETLPL